MRTSSLLRFLTAAGLTAACLNTLGAQGNDSRVTGKVTDPSGQPVVGANLIVRELGISTATTNTGTYSLLIPAARLTGKPMTLTARAIGYTPINRAVTLAAGTMSQDFSLARDPLRLEAVVVTGVAEATQTNRLGFSVGKVDEAQLKEVPAVNPIESLAGKVSAAHVTTGSGMPGSETNVRLRSATSISPGANNQPLVIVDGVITKSGLADINTEDIESIEVLKGPASAGIYGSDAAAGVINVITKRGRSSPEGTTVTTLRNEVGSSGVTKTMDLNQSTDCITRVTNPTTGLSDFPRDASGRVVGCTLSNFFDQPYPAGAPFRNQQKEILNNGTFYTNYLSVGRRAGSTNFQASFENLHNGGIIDIPGVDLNGLSRRNVRLNVDQFVRDNLDLSVGGFYTSSNNQLLAQGAGSPFFSTLLMPPDVALTDSNSNGQPFRVDIGKFGATPSTDPNPLYTVFTSANNEDKTRTQGSFHTQYRPLSWFSIDGNYGYDRATTDDNSYRPKGFLNTGAVPQGGSLALANASTTAQNASIIGAVTQDWGGTHAIFRGSYLFEDEHDLFNTASGSNFGAAGVPTLSNVDPTSRNIASSEQTIRARNWFGQAVFDINDRFNVDGLVRRDGSSLFGPDARYRTFYRATGSYLVSHDFEMPDVDEFRVRLSRGTAGLRPPFSAQYETFTISGGQIVPGILGNKDLRPAYATETEGGFNLGMWKRASLEYTYSQKVTQDQVLPVPLSSVNGFQLQWRNAGTITGNTHEASLGIVLMERPDVSWHVNITGDRTRQRVTSLNVAPFRFGAGCGANLSQCSAGAGQSSDVFLIKQGEDLGAMYGTHWVRNCDELKTTLGSTTDCSQYVINSDGLMVAKGTPGTATEVPIQFKDASGNTTVKIGDANPDFESGISSNLNWRNFTFYGLIDMVHGGNIYNLPRQWLNRAEFRAPELDQAGKDSASKNPKAYYSALNDANTPNDWFVEPGSYTKLRELSVGYTLSNNLMQTLRLNRFSNSVKVSLIGRNLYTWTKYSGLDPEISAVGSVTGTGSTQGVGDPTIFRLDSFGYPNFRTFSFMFEFGM